jgi:hypothetical protein
LFKSIDNGSTWDKISDGINVSQIYHMAGADADINVLATGMQDNGLKSRTTLTSSFNQNGSGDGFDVAVKHDDVTNGYGVINKTVYSMNLNGGVSNDFGPVDQWYPTLAVHPTTSSTVYCGYVDVYKSTNGGVDWTNKGGNGGWCMTTCPSNSNRIYAAGGVNEYNDDPNGILGRSDNGGDSWTTVFNSGDATYSKITSVAVDPSNSNNVWITLGGYNDGVKVFRSTNAGGGWTNVSGSLPNLPVNCVALDGNNNAYVGTDLGVFYRGSAQTDWTPFYTGLPRVPVTDLAVNEGSTVIRAATFGRGIYSANLYSTCVASLLLNSSYIGNDYYEASSTITSAGNITGGAGTQIFFKAGSYITLSDGFDVTSGNEFMAYLGGCGNGVPSMKTGDESKEFANLPSPALLPFRTFGHIEITKVNEVNCNVKITRKTDNPDMRIDLLDEEGNILKNERITAVNNQTEIIYSIAYNFLPGQLYKALFYIENNLVHWQEIYYD